MDKKPSEKAVEIATNAAYEIYGKAPANPTEDSHPGYIALKHLMYVSITALIAAGWPELSEDRDD